MKVKHIIVSLVFLVSMGSVQATVYQCKENGKMLFKDKPCEKTQKIVESGSDMDTIIANKIKYDKRCTQKIIRLVSKHSAKTLTNVEVGRWNGKKRIKAINQKVICNEQSGLTKEVLSKSVEGEVVADWANMMQWTTKGRHTLRAEWGRDKVISKVTMYRDSIAMPSKPVPRKFISSKNVTSTKVVESTKCKMAAAQKWLLDFTMRNAKMTGGQQIQAIENVSSLVKKIKRNCNDSSIANDVRMSANKGIKPSWIKPQIDYLINYASESMK